jgi:hypothetical protein
MAVTTRDQLEARGGRLTEGLRKAASALSGASDLFLSHSAKDKGGLLNGAIAILGENGASVYADVLDPEAKQLSPDVFGGFFSQAISDTGRLVVLVTRQTTASRWVPWELGLAHGMHSAARVAVWPVKNPGENESWAQQEYFAIYPRIEWVDIFGEEQWGVRNPDSGRFWRLSFWLRKSRRVG